MGFQCRERIDRAHSGGGRTLFHGKLRAYTSGDFGIAHHTALSGNKEQLIGLVDRPVQTGGGQLRGQDNAMFF